MSIKKALIIVLSVLVVFIVILIVSVVLKKNTIKNQPPIISSIIVPVKKEQTPVVATSTVVNVSTTTQINEIPEEIKKIMNDNITGTVERITDKLIVVKDKDGSSKEMPIDPGKTFVISQANNAMENKKLSDIKVGMSVYVHYEKETYLASTITLTQ